MITIGGIFLFVSIACLGEPCRPQTFQRAYPTLPECQKAAASIRKQHPQAYVTCDGAR